MTQMESKEQCTSFFFFCKLGGTFLFIYAGQATLKYLYFGLNLPIGNQVRWPSKCFECLPKLKLSLYPI
jgi:hypothetical protein